MENIKFLTMFRHPRNSRFQVIDPETYMIERWRMNLYVLVVREQATMF
jgi:hypothetical protein